MKLDMNTMADLRREVAQRLRETLHGREIDTMERGMPELPHMLGIVRIGAISTPEVESGTLLDTDHEFWQSYYEDVNTKKRIKDEIKSAMQSLKDDDIFRVTSPYGEEAGIMYIEVGELNESRNRMQTSCAECGESIQTEPELEHNYGWYSIQFTLDCPNCNFKQVVGRRLTNV